MRDVSAALPHSVELEQQLLGAVLSNNDRYHSVSSLVRPEDFYDPVHGAIWRNIAARIERDHLASPVTLAADIENIPGIDDLGGQKYLVRLVGCSAAGFAVGEYARELRGLSDRRTFVDRLAEVSREVGAGEDAAYGVASLETLIAEMGENSAEPRSMSLLKAHTEAAMVQNEMRQTGGNQITTGLAALDELVAFQPSRYTILAGATSMGKTALAVWLAYAAAKAGFGVGFVSLEMGERDLAARISSIDSQVPYKALDRPMSDQLFQKVIEAMKAQEAMPIEIFSARVRDVPAILSEAKRLKAKWPPHEKGFKGLKLLVVDYIQLVRGRGSNEFHALSTVANAFKQVAKQLDVHVIALAQIDRKIGDRDVPRPRLSDLRGSGDLENAPDNVIFGFRPEYYLSRAALNEKDVEKRADIEADLERCRGKMEIIVAKARMGELGSVMVGCDMATNRFYDLVQQGEVDF